MNSWFQFVVESDLFLNGASAFAGAFFAFLFLRLSELLTKLYERQVKHYNSLVGLGVQLNDVGGVIHDNLYVLPRFIQTIGLGNIYFNNLRTIEIDRGPYKDLINPELLDELFSYNYQLRKANDDIETVSSGYQDIKNALIQGNITLQDYRINVVALSENLESLNKFLQNLQEETVILLARVRLRIKQDKPIGSKIIHFFIPAAKKRLRNEEIRKEAARLRLEIEESANKSQKKLKKIFGENESL